MDKISILIAEDSAALGELLLGALNGEGHDIDLVVNGKEAFEKYQEKSYDLVITDIIMPELNGLELITKIKGINENALIIVMSGTTDSSMIVDVMKTNIFDYIIKPVKIDDFMVKINRALEHKKFVQLNQLVEKEKILRMEQQLDWYKWHENFMDKEKQVSDKSLFYSLRTSFAQGAGFGSLLSVMDLIESSSIKEENFYKIKAPLFDMLLDNVKIAKRGFQVFSEIDLLGKNTLEMENVSGDEYYNTISGIVEELQKYCEINHNKILLCDKKLTFSNVSIIANLEYIKRALSEIIINALKFSRKNTDIAIMISVEEECLTTVVINHPAPAKDDILGIPFEYENIVFEPFFRISKVLYESYDSLDYGLGLTLTEKIIKKHNGKISISNVLDHSSVIDSNKNTEAITQKKDPITIVSCETQLPLQKKDL